LPVLPAPSGVRSLLADALAIPALAILVLIGSYAAWAWRDVGVWPWDQAWYGKVTLDLDHLRASGLVVWIEAMLRATVCSFALQRLCLRNHRVLYSSHRC